MGVKTTGIVTLVLALAGCGGAPQSIDRLVVQLALQKDGSLQARETWTLGPGDGDASTLSVDFPRQYHDGLSDVHQGATTPVTFRRQYVAAHTLAWRSLTASPPSACRALLKRDGRSRPSRAVSMRHAKMSRPAKPPH